MAIQRHNHMMNIEHAIPITPHSQGSTNIGPTFGPVKFVNEVSHMEHMHTKLMIMWLNLFENSLLVRFQTDRKLNFGPFRTNESRSKVDFGTNLAIWPLISKRNWGVSKLSRHAYSSHDYLLYKFFGIKIGPPHIPQPFSKWKLINAPPPYRYRKNG